MSKGKRKLLQIMPKWGLRSTNRHIRNTDNVVVHDGRGKNKCYVKTEEEKSMLCQDVL
jgi:hypothetical protein